MSEVVIAAQQQAVARPEYNTKIGTEQPTPKSLLVSTPFACIYTTSTSSSLFPVSSVVTMLFLQFFLPLLAPLLSIPLVSAQKTCYFPDGLPAKDLQGIDNWIPCDPNAEHSSCCLVYDQCLTNGLCLQPHQWNWVWRDACTDPTFQDPSCPKFCFTSQGQNGSPAIPP